MTYATREDEQAAKVVIRPAGAGGTGVRVSASAQTPAGAAQAAAGQGGAKARQPAAPQQAGATPVVRKTTRGKARRKQKPQRPSLYARSMQRLRGIRFRLLPLTIFVAVLLLGVRTGDLWRLASRSAEVPDVAATMADQGAPQYDGPAPHAIASSRILVAQAGDLTSGMAPVLPASFQVAQATPGVPAQGGASNTETVPSVPPDTGTQGAVTNEELLQHFADRRAEIDRRSREVEQREALLTAAERRIDQKIQELEKVRGDIQKLMRQGDERQTAQLDSLVKIYETMKPKEAARIFEELDMPVLLGVVERMKEQKTAPILAAMDPVKAKEVTAALIGGRSIPNMPQSE